MRCLVHPSKIAENRPKIAQKSLKIAPKSLATRAEWLSSTSQTKCHDVKVGVGPLRAMVKSAKVRPTPYVWYLRVERLLIRENARIQNQNDRVN